MTSNITTFYCGPSPLEILRITKEGIWANPDVPVDEAAKKVLEAIDHNIKVLVQKAVEEEREKVARWMMERGYATGHGDTIESLLKELEWQFRESEREACAKVCDEMEKKAEEHGTECCKWPTPSDCAYAIRAIEAKLKENNNG
jgi:hypothetical protein